MKMNRGTGDWDRVFGGWGAKCEGSVSGFREKLKRLAQNENTSCIKDQIWLFSGGEGETGVWGVGVR